MFLGHNPFAQPTYRPWVTFNDKSRMCFLNYLNYPLLGVPFLKGVILCCVILVTLNFSCVNVKRIDYIFFTYKINATSFSLCKMHALPFFHDYVSPYTWFHNNMTNMPNIWHVTWIQFPQPPSLQQTYDCGNSNSFSWFPLLIKLRLWTMSGMNISHSNVRSKWETLSDKNISHF